MVAQGDIFSVLIDARKKHEKQRIWEKKKGPAWKKRLETL